MATALHHLSDYDPANVPDASNMCFGIVVSEWNSEITDALLKGAVDTLGVCLVALSLFMVRNKCVRTTVSTLLLS